MTTVEVQDISEDWENDSIDRITDNNKTFVFVRSGGFGRTTSGARAGRSAFGKLLGKIFSIVEDSELTFYKMSMEQGGDHIWSEQEVETIREAYLLAKKTASERAELDDSLSVDDTNFSELLKT